MTHVLTLIANPAVFALEESHGRQVAGLLPQASKPEWLAPSEACDIAFTPDAQADLSAIENTARGALGGIPVDIVFQPVKKRRKHLLVADMDSTLIGQECIDELADFAGLKPKIAAITERTMRGELEFESALRERVGLLAGLQEEVLHKVFAERISLTSGVRTLAATMRANGAATVVVSGGFTFFTSRVAEAAGFETHYANTLEVLNGTLTGRVVEPILGQQAKLDTLRLFRKKLGLSREDTLAVGDGANDLAMLEEAGLGVAYRAKPVVAEKAMARIDHANLTALLFAQGYRRTEFVEDKPAA